MKACSQFLFRLVLLTPLLLGTVISANAQVIQEWVATYSGPASAFDGITDMVMDDAGNVYVTGFSDADSDWFGGDYATAKYNWAGQQQWVATYNGPGDGEDKPTGIGVDSDGNVYVTGWSIGIGTDDDYATVKYSANGVEQWVARYNGPGNGSDMPQALTLDHAGNVIVTGAGSSAGGGYPYWDQTTIKYSPAGVEQWVAVYAGAWGFNDLATAVAVDDLNNVVITGWTAVASNYYDYCTVKYNSAGVQQWVATYAFNNGSYDGDNAYDVALDALGNVYVTGMSDGDTSAAANSDYATVKYDANGVQQWVARYNGTANGTDWCWSVTVDASSNVYVAGSSAGVGSFEDAVTIKYNSAGVEQWVARYNGENNSSDGFSDVAVDVNGNVYVPGWCDGSTPFLGGDALVIKYDASGVEQWATQFIGSAGGGDWVHSIELAADGDILVAGDTWGGMNYDFLIIKYDEPDVSLTLTPHNPPIQIPAGGGNFRFDLQVQNTGSTNYTVDIWTDVTLPGGNHYPIVTRSNVPLNAGGNIIRPDLTQFVPASALSGEYFYNAYVRDHNTWEVLATDAFSFVKLEGDALPNHDFGWSLYGWDGEEAPVASLPTKFELHPANPNPFNPTTVASYELRDASYVSLNVYDTAGRLVTILVNGWREAGTHKVIFDGSALAGGMYIARLEAGDNVGVEKMVLLK